MHIFRDVLTCFFRLQPPSSLGGWVKSLPLASLLMDALPRPYMQHSLRAASELAAGEIRIVAHEFARGLERMLTESVRSLKASFDAMDKEFDKKSTCKEGSRTNAANKFSVYPEMKCGTIEDFHKGLVGRIGAFAEFFLVYEFRFRSRLTTSLL